MRYLFVFILILPTFFTQAQEQLGMRTDNYSGIYGTLLNPSHNVTSLFNWDVNLIAGGFYGNTNYGYIENSNVFRSARNADNFILRRDIENTTPVGENNLIGEFNNNSRRKYITLFANGMGPSFMVKLRNGHSFGLFTNVRSAFSTHDIPANLNYNVFFDTPYNEFIDVGATKASTMVWSEVGLNYAFKKDTYDGYICIGASLKFVNAYEAAYVNTNKVTPSAQNRNDTLFFQSPNLSYGITTANLEGEDIGPSSNGFGVSVDLGFTYVYEGDEDHYKWKIGVSLLDMGQIDMSRNAQEHNLKTDSLVVFPSLQFESITNQERINLLSEIALADSSASLTSSSFRLGLPGALSLQGDYFIGSGVYVGGVFVQRIPMGANSLRRNNILAAVPRYERRWFGFSLPVVLTNYQKLSLGASFRLAFLTIGSDDIGSFFGKRNLDSTDFYVGLKINPFNLGLDLGGGRRRSGKGVKCYEF